MKKVLLLLVLSISLTVVGQKDTIVLKTGKMLFPEKILGIDKNGEICISDENSFSRFISINNVDSYTHHGDYKDLSNKVKLCDHIKLYSYTPMVNKTIGTGIHDINARLQGFRDYQVISIYTSLGGAFLQTVAISNYNPKNPEIFIGLNVVAVILYSVSAYHYFDSFKFFNIEKGNMVIEF